jgi:hypothetical protein
MGLLKYMLKKDRAVMDVAVQSLTELVLHKQNLENRISDMTASGGDGSEIEASKCCR